MKLKLFLLSILPFCPLLSSHNPERDEFMWRHAYYGDFSLVHRIVLGRESEEINDALLNQFLMAYVYYKAERYEEIAPIFKGIDNYIEHLLIPKEKRHVVE